MNIKNLSIFREKLDAIDEKLIDLLHKRYKIVEDVEEYKRTSGKYKGFIYISPTREHQMLKQYLNNIDEHYVDRYLVKNIFRNLISYANFFEQPQINIWHKHSASNEEITIITSYYPLYMLYSTYVNFSAISFSRTTIITINVKDIDFQKIEILQNNMMSLYHIETGLYTSVKIAFFAKIRETYDENDAIYVYFNTTTEKIEQISKTSTTVLAKNLIYIGSHGPNLL